MNGQKDAKYLADEQVFLFLQRVIQNSHERSKTDKVALALLYFLVRVANTWRSIRVIHEHIPDEEGPMLDVGTLLRAMFDAYLQAEYVVNDPRLALERAQDYLEFGHVENYRHAQRVTSFDNSFSKRLKTSPLKQEGEKRLQREFDRVKSRYLTEKPRPDGTIKHGPGTRQNWFRGSLADIAKSLDKEDEYRILLATFHGCVHSGPLTVRQGIPISRQYVLDWASRIAVRVARLSVEHNRISLSELHSKMLVLFSQPYFE